MDWNHPLAVALLVALVGNEGGGQPVDLATSASVTPTGGSTWSTASQGVAKSYNGSTQYDSVSNRYQGGGHVTVATRMAFTSLPQTFPVVVGLRTGVPACELRGSALATGWQFTDEGGNVAAASSTAPAAGVLADVTGVQTGNTVLIYVNGIAEGSDAGGATAGFSDAHVVGSRSGTLFAAMLLDHLLIYNRVLTASEIQWLSQEPYAMLQPIVRRRYFAPSSPGSPGRKRGRISSLEIGAAALGALFTFRERGQ